MEFFVSYETEIVNNGIFFTDSNGLQLMERNTMSSDEDFESDTITLGSKLFPVTTIAMIQDTINQSQLGILVGTPTFATSIREGQLLLGLFRLNEGKDRRSKPSPIKEEVGFGSSKKSQIYLSH